MFGYGDILRIDLDRGKSHREPLPSSWVRCFLGGQGINDYLFWEHFCHEDPGIEPLTPENVFIIGLGPFLGTGLGLGSKTKFTFKGPAYRMFADSVSGGAFGSHLRWAGYDYVVITGRAEKPVYIFIHDQGVELREASHLWGLKAHEADALIKKELGDNEVHTAIIGPAGENGVTFASITVSCHRAAGRCGGGAVLGSKRVKAIAARGTRGISVFDPEGFLKAAGELRQVLESMRGVDDWKMMGTLSIVDGYNRIGSNAWRNIQSGIIPEEALEKLSAYWYVKHMKQHGLSCSPGCASACSSWYRLRGDESPAAAQLAGEEFSKPEYLAVASFGMMCDIRDLPAVAHLNKLASEYGMDLMEVGSIAALIMELREKGILSPEELSQWCGEALSWRWGDWKAVGKLMGLIAGQKNQLGELFREGVSRGALKLEKLKETPVVRYVNSGKGGSPFNEEVRPFPTWATNMAVASRGADHLKGLSAMDKWGGTKLSTRWFGRPEAGERFTPTLKGAASAKSENFSAFVNSLGFCILSSGMGIMNIPLSILLKAYYALTGIPLTEDEVWAIGERVCNLEKAFNSRLGLTREDDRLCERWLKEPAAGGPGKGIKAEDYLTTTLDEYYELRGWDRATGLQRRQTLERLGLEEVAQVLAQENRLAP